MDGAEKGNPDKKDKKKKKKPSVLTQMDPSLASLILCVPLKIPLKLEN